MKMLHGFSANQYEFLSNFYACDTFYANELTGPEGMVFKTSEHAFQAAKATTLEDMRYVALARTPGEAKRRGRSIPFRSDWDEIKDQVMYEIVKEKFKNPDMRQRIISVINEGYDSFCEDNWWHDNYWGDCQCEKCKNIEGRNELGKILTKVANEIINEIVRRK